MEPTNAIANAETQNELNQMVQCTQCGRRLHPLITFHDLFQALMLISSLHENMFHQDNPKLNIS